MELEPATILVVDDELGIREGCRRVLGRQGHQVVVTSTGEDGWEQVQSGQFDLALLDVMMPGISGIELLKRIVAFDPYLVCIIITGYATIELAVQAIKEGAYNFIAKPFESSALLLTVRCDDCQGEHIECPPIKQSGRQNDLRCVACGRIVLREHAGDGLVAARVAAKPIQRRGHGLEDGSHAVAGG